jgi:hypothetical protein
MVLSVGGFIREENDLIQKLDHVIKDQMREEHILLLKVDAENDFSLVNGEISQLNAIDIEKASMVDKKLGMCVFGLFPVFLELEYPTDDF